MSKDTPKTLQEFQDFAYSLGEHTQTFSDDVQYKTFIQNLLKDLMKGLTWEESNKILVHLNQLKTERAKQEKAGDVVHFLKNKEGSGSDDESDDSFGEGPNDLYSDFM